MYVSLRSLYFQTLESKACFPHSAGLGDATYTHGVGMPGCVCGKIDLWGGEQAAAWVRGSASTPEGLRVASVT